jgi:hypothetical protein
VLGDGVKDLSVRVDLHVSRSIVGVGATRRGDRGDLCEEAGVDVAYIHFDPVCAEHGYERVVRWRVEFNAVGAIALSPEEWGRLRTNAKMGEGYKRVPEQLVFCLQIQVHLRVQTRFVGVYSQILRLQDRSDEPHPSGLPLSRYEYMEVAPLYMTMSQLRYTIRLNPRENRRGYILIGTLLI